MHGVHGERSYIKTLASNPPAWATLQVGAAPVAAVDEPTKY